MNACSLSQKKPRRCVPSVVGIGGAGFPLQAVAYKDYELSKTLVLKRTNKITCGGQICTHRNTNLYTLISLSLWRSSAFRPTGLCDGAQRSGRPGPGWTWPGMNVCNRARRLGLCNRPKLMTSSHSPRHFLTY
jgi:hypothetical protein